MTWKPLRKIHELYENASERLLHRSEARRARETQIKREYAGRSEFDVVKKFYENMVGLKDKAYDFGEKIYESVKDGVNHMKKKDDEDEDA